MSRRQDKKGYVVYMPKYSRWFLRETIDTKGRYDIAMTIDPMSAKIFDSMGDVENMLAKTGGEYEVYDIYQRKIVAMEPTKTLSAERAGTQAEVKKNEVNFVTAFFRGVWSKTQDDWDFRIHMVGLTVSLIVGISIGITFLLIGMDAARIVFGGFIFMFGYLFGVIGALIIPPMFKSIIEGFDDIMSRGRNDQ